MKLATKLRLGVSFLFAVILVFGWLSLFYITRLTNDSKSVVKNNIESLLYSNNMLKALEEIPANKNAINIFTDNLTKQEANITEPGETEATARIRKNLIQIRNRSGDTAGFASIRQSIHVITELNQQAIIQKNEKAKKTGADAIFWLTIVFSVLGLITFSFVVNFPSVISTPIRVLNEAISEITNKNYSKRIHLSQNDDFGELANAFNSMAEKLNEYENSNLAQLRFEKSRIETVINQMKDGIIGLDVKKNILFVNTVAEKLLGLNEKEIVGKYVADVAVKNDLMRSLLRDQDKKDLKIFADGKESYYNKDMLEVKNNGTTIGEVIILRNITIFHELNEAKTNFIATVSHELKTPISSIKMSAQLLNDERIGALNGEQNDLIKSISDDAERLLKITSELLNISQVETGRIELNIKMVKPLAIIENAIQTVMANAREKNISIRNNATQSLPLISADADKTTWVLNNLLTNAIKYSYNNALVEIAAKAENGNMIFSVADNGPGISDEHLPRLFERYYQAPGSIEKGNGLGLAISKDFIEAQQGKIWVESEPGRGTVFYFSLPYT